MQYQEALEIALKNVDITNKIETVNIEEALNRVVSANIYSTRALPPYNNSAMDGYAFKHKDINSKLNIVTTILAGDIQKPILKESECYKIMTGAKVPSDCDTIAPKEICEVKDSRVLIKKEIKKGSAIRLKGEEISASRVIIKKGERLNAAKIALLASQGTTKIECYKELKIAIIATGSELKELGEVATEDEIYNINGINIKMHLKQYGIGSTYLGVQPDNLKESIEFFKQLSSYDIAITTGGISVGDADFTKEALVQNGFKELFCGIKVKPGHPTLMGKIDKTFIMAMPGNPLAAIIHILILGLPIILKMQGAKELYFKSYSAKITTDLKLKSGRANIVLGEHKNSNFTPYKNNKYGSGMITPLVESNSFAIFKEDISSIKKGSTIKVAEFQSSPYSEILDYFM